MSDRHGTDQPRPLAYGYFFSLGHSAIVFAIGVAIIIAAKTVLPAVTHSNRRWSRSAAPSARSSPPPSCS